MLPRVYRIIVVNNSGQTVTFDSNGRFNLKVTGWLITPADGKIAYTTDADDDLAFVSGDSTVDGAEEKSSEIVNNSDLFIGAQIQLEVTHDAGTAADGSFDIYLDGGDLTGELASDASGYASAGANFLQHIGSLVWEPNGLDDEVMRSAVINI